MSEVTREDVIEFALAHVQAIDWMGDSAENACSCGWEGFERTKSGTRRVRQVDVPFEEHFADALIAAFPHLVGGVQRAIRPSSPTIDGFIRHGVRTVYTVTGPWRGVER